MLFVTGYAENATARAEFLDRGMDMLTKLFDFDVLGAKVRAMIKRWGRARSPPIGANARFSATAWLNVMGRPGTPR